MATKPPAKPRVGRQLALAKTPAPGTHSLHANDLQAQLHAHPLPTDAWATGTPVGKGKAKARFVNHPTLGRFVMKLDPEGRERAGYLLASAFGLQAPPTALVTNRGRQYAVSKVIEHALDADHFMVREFDYKLRDYVEVMPPEVKLFDMLIANYDRNTGNWLFELPADMPLPTTYQKPPANAKIWLIDHGRGLGALDNPPTMRFKIFGDVHGGGKMHAALVASPGFVSKLRTLDAAAMRDLVKDATLLPGEFDALMQRRQLMLDLADGVQP